MKNFLSTGAAVILTLGSDLFQKKIFQEEIDRNYELINLKYLPSICQIKSLNPDLIILNLHGQKNEALDHFIKLGREIKNQYGSDLPVICICSENLKKQLNNYHFERIWHTNVTPSQILEEINDLLGKSRNQKQLWDALAKLEDFKNNVHREMEQASIFQGALFNQAIARTNLQVAYHYLFQKEIGGDFFKIFDLSASHVGILIGDVRGRGAGAALLTGFILGELYTMNSEKQRILWAPPLLLAHLSESIYSHNQMSELCLTAWYGVLELPSGKLEYARAGHPMPLYIDPIGREAHFIEGGSGFPLGIFPGMTYRNNQVQLPLQARLLLYTDGLINQKDVYGAQINPNWLRDCFSASYLQNKTWKDTPAILDSTFTDLAQGADPIDDRVILCCEIPPVNQAYIEIAPKEGNEKSESLLAKIEANHLEMVLEQIMGSLPKELEAEILNEFELSIEEILNKACTQVQKARLIAASQEQKPQAKGFTVNWWVHSDRLDVSIRLDKYALPWCYIPDIKSKEENKIEIASLILYFDNIHASNDGMEISMSKWNKNSVGSIPDGNLKQQKS
jgi:Stage II sporulation protein E (SpoIIE)